MDYKENAVAFFQKNGYTVSSETEKALERYLELLLEYNARFNLTAVTEPSEVYVKHFLDSLCGVQLLPQGARVADIGSGAGFPAAVLALFRKDITVTMLEANGKKVSFLQTLIKELPLDNAVAIKTRAEDAARTALRASFDIVTARAVTALSPLAEYALPLLKVGGKLIAYKGNADEEVLSAQTAFKKLGCVLAEHRKYTLNGEYARSLVVLEKNKETPSEYPRANGKIKKYPL